MEGNDGVPQLLSVVEENHLLRRHVVHDLPQLQLQQPYLVVTAHSGNGHHIASSGIPFPSRVASSRCHVCLLRPTTTTTTTVSYGCCCCCCPLLPSRPAHQRTVFGSGSGSSRSSGSGSSSSLSCSLPPPIPSAVLPRICVSTTVATTHLILMLIHHPGGHAFSSFCRPGGYFLATSESMDLQQRAWPCATNQ